MKRRTTIFLQVGQETSSLRNTLGFDINGFEEMFTLTTEVGERLALVLTQFVHD